MVATTAVCDIATQAQAMGASYITEGLSYSSLWGPGNGC